MSDDPLSDLLLDAEEVDRARLARALKGSLGVDGETGRIVLKPGFTELSARMKVLAYLMGRKAALLLGRAEQEAAAPKEVIADTGLPSGTVHPTLKQLKDGRRVTQTDSGRYYLGPHQVLEAIQDLEKGTRHEE